MDVGSDIMAASMVTEECKAPQDSRWKVEELADGCVSWIVRYAGRLGLKLYLLLHLNCSRP